MAGKAILSLCSAVGSESVPNWGPSVINYSDLILSALGLQLAAETNVPRRECMKVIILRGQRKAYGLALEMIAHLDYPNLVTTRCAASNAVILRPTVIDFDSFGKPPRAPRRFGMGALPLVGMAR